MKPRKTLVKDLNDKIGPHSIRLKVIDKGNAQHSPNNKQIHYQRIVFQDEEGGKIKTTLYNDDIDAFENIIQKGGEYDISNAKIKVMPEKYRRNADDYPYQLSFGADTIIRAVEGTKVPTGPEYLLIASILRTVHPDDRYDLLAVLIYVEPLRHIPRSTGPDLDVRELVVFYHSTSQPLIITAWAELATRDSEQLNEVAANFPVVGFPSLKPSYHKGFSLSTTTSTYVMLQPVGDKVDTLRIWRDKNRMIVSVKHSQLVAARNPVSERATTTIKELRLKKAADVLQEERFWLKVFIPEFDRKDVRFYLGCSHGGASSNRDTDAIYNYGVCKRNGVTSVPRMSIGFEAVDRTSSFMFTTFTHDSEKLLKTKTEDLYTMDPEEKKEYMQQAESRIRASTIYNQVGPAHSLSTNGALKWVLKQLSLE